MVYNSALNKNGSFRTDYIKERSAPGKLAEPMVFQPTVLPQKYAGDAFSLLQREPGSIAPMFHPLAGTSLNDILDEFSKFNHSVILIGYVLMILYAGLMLMNLRSRLVYSSTGVAMSGVLLVTFATVAGLGCATVFGIQFNAATTNIVPFLTLGLGVDDMFLLVHNYQEIVHMVHKNEIGFLLKETGLSVLLTSICNILSFSVGGLIPVPALRSFCWQVAIVLAFNLVCILSLYPAMLSIDLVRRQRRLVDIFCCFRVNQDKVQPAGASETERRLSDAHSRSAGSTGKIRIESGSLAKPKAVTGPVQATKDPSSDKYDPLRDGQIETKHSGSPTYNGHLMTERGDTPDSNDRTKSSKWSSLCSAVGSNPETGGFIQNFVINYYAPFLSYMSVKIGVVIFFVALFCVGIIGCVRIQHGLELTDVVPKDTAPYDFLSAREKYFSFYLFEAKIKEGFDYSLHQKLVHEYRKQLGDIDYVVKNQGSLGQTYWLALFTEWVKGMQKELNDALTAGTITPDGPQCNGKEFLASARQIQAWKLLINEYDGINEKNVGNNILIDHNNIINPTGFYNYLTAWYHWDRLTYEFSRASFVPPPRVNWAEPAATNCSSLTNAQKRIPPAKELLVSNIPFFVVGLDSTAKIVDFIKKVRAICDDFESNHGLPNYPSGITFTFWEQYISLTRNLVVSIVVIMICVFSVITCLLLNPWTGAVIVLVITMMIVELAGYMGILGLKLNPISAVTLVTEVGIAVEFTVHMALSYLTALGTPNERMTRTLDHMFEPVLHGGISTLLGIIMLAFSEFEFIRQYFFMVMAGLIVLGLLNGLILLPVLLSLIGPPPEVQPIDGSNVLLPPTPKNRRRKQKSSTGSHHNSSGGGNTTALPNGKAAANGGPVLQHTGSVVYGANNYNGGNTQTKYDAGTRKGSESPAVSLSTITEENTPPQSTTPLGHSHSTQNNRHSYNKGSGPLFRHEHEAVIHNAGGPRPIRPKEEHTFFASPLKRPNQELATASSTHSVPNAKFDAQASSSFANSAADQNPQDASSHRFRSGPNLHPSTSCDINGIVSASYNESHAADRRNSSPNPAAAGQSRGYVPSSLVEQKSDGGKLGDDYNNESFPMTERSTSNKSNNSINNESNGNHNADHSSARSNRAFAPSSNLPRQQSTSVDGDEEYHGSPQTNHSKESLNKYNHNHNNNNNNEVTGNFTRENAMKNNNEACEYDTPPADEADVDGEVEDNGVRNRSRNGKGSYVQLHNTSYESRPNTQAGSRQSNVTATSNIDDEP